jgi:hypothetical protein
VAQVIGGGPMTAYDRLLGLLRERGPVRDNGYEARTQCPAHDGKRRDTLAVYRKPGRVKIVCFAGCNDVLDILPALGLALPDLFDEPGSRHYRPDPDLQARIEARRKMTLVQRAVDDLLRLPDLAERISRAIIWHDNARRLRGNRNG